ncbi:MAG: CsiV family protein [Gammaproteobacteria bacterium]
MSIRSCLTGLCCLFGFAPVASAQTAAAPATAAPVVTNISAQAKTAPNWYSVEVLVFRYTATSAMANGGSSSSVPRPSLAHAVYPPAKPQGAYSVLANVSAPIASAQRKLVTAGGYAPLLELGWQQPQTPLGQATPVSLAPPGGAPAMSNGDGGTDQVQVIGTVTVLESTHKPNVALNLRLCEPAPPGLAPQPPPTARSAAVPVFSQTSIAPVAQSLRMAESPSGETCFALNQQRFVTSGKLEYFDSPAFGALVLVQPISAPE